MPNNHREKKDAVDSKYGKGNVLWGDEVSDIGIAAAGLSAYFGVTAGYDYFRTKLAKFQRFGLEAAGFLAKKGDPTKHKIRFDTITIDHWENIPNPLTGKKKKLYIKRSYRYFMAVKKR